MRSIKNTTLPTRVVVYSRDIENITGRKRSAAEKLLARIREKNLKAPGQFVTIREFCQHTGIDEETVKFFIRELG